MKVLHSKWAGKKVATPPRRVSIYIKNHFGRMNISRKSMLSVGKEGVALCMSLFISTRVAAFPG
jgi:hypothetical protein